MENSKSLPAYRWGLKSDPIVISCKNLPKRELFVSAAKCLSQKTLRCITSFKDGLQTSGISGDTVIFLLTTAALEIVRRFTRARCPFIWHGLQALQIFSYPPFKWIQRWAPFSGLVKQAQRLSGPMLVLSIATLFSDQSTDPEALGQWNETNAESESDSTLQLGNRSTSHDEVSTSGTSNSWLVDLRQELERQGISLPERLDDDELRRYYASVNGDVSKLTAAVKRTVLWRQNYTMFSAEELEAWSDLVFWHGHDVKQRPSVIICLGRACSRLRSNDMPLLVKAVVSQIEHGVMNMLDAEHPQLTVVMDCAGLSPFGFPIHTMRSCAILLQDHYPNRLGALVIVRLPRIARVITQALFQVLRPGTRKKLRVIGGNYREILSDFLQPLPSFLGGSCSCSKCSGVVSIQERNEEITAAISKVDMDKEIPPEFHGAVDVDVHTDTRPMFDHDTKAVPDSGKRPDSQLPYGLYPNRNWEQLVRFVVIGLLMMWIIAALLLGIRYQERLPLLYWGSFS